MHPCPWPSRRLRALGDSIRDGTPLPPGTPDYATVMDWYGEIVAEVELAIERLDWQALLGDRAPKVTSRIKTIDTLRDKLRAQASMTLPAIQDVGGVRLEAEMTLTEQDAVVQSIRHLFGHDESSVKDLRTHDHCGYRAVHLWLRLDCRIEVQVRTHLQDAWANIYEAAAALFGRGIRYGALPDDEFSSALVSRLQRLSTSEIAALERCADALQRQKTSFAADLHKMSDNRELHLRAVLSNVRERFGAAPRKERS